MALAALSSTSPVWISKTLESTLSNGDSEQAVVSPNGDLVAFASTSTQLVEGDGNERSDVFIRGSSGKILRVSVGPEGLEANSDSFQPSISSVGADGSFGVAFTSYATNLVPGMDGGANEIKHVFVRVRFRETTSPYALKEKTILVSKVPGSDPLVPGNGDSEGPSIVALDGGQKYLIAFSSLADNLMPLPALEPGDFGGHAKLYFAVVNPATGAVSLDVFSIKSAGVDRLPNGNVKDAVLSGDGLAVAYVTDANNMGWNSLGYEQVAISRRNSKTATLISKTESGDPGNQGSGSPSISFSATSVAFRTTAFNLSASSSNPRLYLYTKATGSLSLINANQSGQVGNAFSGSRVRIHPNGRLAVFTDASSNLIGGGVDTNSATDVFVKDLSDPDGVEKGEVVRVNMKGTTQESDGFVTVGSLGAIDASSTAATVGFQSTGNLLRPDAAKCDAQLDNCFDEVYRAIVSFSAPPFTADTRIEVPPTVKTRPKQIQLVLQTFSASSSSATFSAKEVEALAAKVSYTILIRNSTTKKSTRIRSTRNRVTLRNVSPGKYTVRYRVTGKTSSGKTVTTKYSPASTVTVRRK